MFVATFLFHHFLIKKYRLDDAEQIFQDLPKDLRNIIKNLGKKSTQDKMEEAILALCSWKEMSADNLACLLKRKNTREICSTHGDEFWWAC